MAMGNGSTVHPGDLANRPVMTRMINRYRSCTLKLMSCRNRLQSSGAQRGKLPKPEQRVAIRVETFVGMARGESLRMLCAQSWKVCCSPRRCACTTGSCLKGTLSRLAPHRGINCTLLEGFDPCGASRIRIDQK